jgi:hypothetical protein
MRWSRRAPSRFDLRGVSQRSSKVSGVARSDSQAVARRTRSTVAKTTFRVSGIGDKKADGDRGLPYRPGKERKKRETPEHESERLMTEKPCKP